MSNAGSLGRRDFRNGGDEELIGCASSGIPLAAPANVTFGDPAVGDDYYVPRYMTANTDGTIIVTGWHADDLPHTRNVVTGQIIHFRPKAITGGTADVILEY